MSQPRAFKACISGEIRPSVAFGQMLGRSVFQPEKPGKDLDDPHHHNGCEQIFDAVLRDQRHHHDRKRARRARRAPGPTAPRGFR